jgi:hypothetical protein
VRIGRWPNAEVRAYVCPGGGSRREGIMGAGMGERRSTPGSEKGCVGG